MKADEVIGAFFDWEEKQPGVITNCKAFQAGAAYAATLRQQAGRVDEDEGFNPRRFVRHMADVLEAGGDLFKIDADLARLGAAIQAALAQNTQGEAVMPEWADKDDKGRFEDCEKFLKSYGFRITSADHAERARVPDSDRIDWVEANARSVSFGKAPGQGYWVHMQGVGYGSYSSNESLRGAIDSAREAQAAELAAAPSQRAEVK